MFERKNLGEGIVLVDLTMKDESMNVWNHKSIAAFKSLVAELWSDQEVKGLILTSTRREFMAGADLKDLMPLTDVEKNKKLINDLDTVFRTLETSGRPVVAAINGLALGGGYELCLACHHRVALSDNRIRIGLPEAKLGLIPGAGGTQRLPRLIGYKAALQLMTEGKTLPPDRALEMGLVDELAQDTDELIEKAKKWVKDHPEARQPWDEKKFKIPGGGVQTPGGYMVFSAGTAMLHEKTFGNYLAPRAIMSAVYEGLDLAFDEGVKVETRYFIQCIKSPAATGIIRTLFFGVNELNKGAARPQNIETKKFKKVGILGAGMMGAGIAYASAAKGIQVVLKDVSMDAAEKGKAYTKKVLSKKVKRGQMSEGQLEEVLGLIHPTVEAGDLKGCDLIIEAVTENRKIKEAVMKEAQAVVGPDVLIASNTSTLPITGLSVYVEKPESFVGIHFFSPVDKMPLVEIIRGKATSDSAVAGAYDLVRQLGKTPIVVNDGRAFYTSRVFTSYVNEGMACLLDGVSPVLIENAGKMAGMPVGPLSVADEVSLDLIYHIVKQTEEDTGTKLDWAASQVGQLFVEKLKRLGRKSGGGFYDYPEGQPKHLWSELNEYFPTNEEQPSVHEVMDRLLFAQAIQAAEAYSEGVVTHPRDGDVGSIMGWGFPAFTGGIFSFMQAQGLDHFVARAKELAEKYGSRFAVPEKIRQMAQKGEAFYGEGQ